jgi:molybdenum-dependent DNA-binding transcriptional regulator ModE
VFRVCASSQAALHDVCKRLLDETMALERDAKPALETLADNVSSGSLERVRRVKGRMNSLTGRVAGRGCHHVLWASTPVL